MNDFSFIEITMNNGLTYTIQSQFEPRTVIQRIKDNMEDELIIIREIGGYVVLNKNKIVGINVKAIKGCWEVGMQKIDLSLVSKFVDASIANDKKLALKLAKGQYEA